MTTEKAVLAGGCFWGMQDMFRRLRGVASTRVGYTGGDIANPSYGNNQRHAEAIEIVFDPAVVSYRAVLEHFFQVHDPTTYEQQGSDFGSSYRSAIFYTDDQQKETALATIAEIEASGLWPGPVVTEINPEEPFWQAEPEHQDYLQRRPSGYSCHFIRPNWRLPSALRSRIRGPAEEPKN
jgi:peptide-methionine (S)-S-oxide reductase